MGATRCATGLVDDEPCRYPDACSARVPATDVVRAERCAGAFASMAAGLVHPALKGMI